MLFLAYSTEWSDSNTIACKSCDQSCHVIRGTSCEHEGYNTIGNISCYVFSLQDKALASHSCIFKVSMPTKFHITKLIHSKLNGSAQQKFVHRDIAAI